MVFSISSKVEATLLFMVPLKSLAQDSTDVCTLPENPIFRIKINCLLREGSSLIMDIVIDLQVLGFSALSRAPLLEVKASIYFWLMYN